MLGKQNILIFFLFNVSVSSAQLDTLPPRQIDIVLGHKKLPKPTVVLVDTSELIDDFVAGDEFAKFSSIYLDSGFSYFSSISYCIEEGKAFPIKFRPRNEFDIIVQNFSIKYFEKYRWKHVAKPHGKKLIVDLSILFNGDSKNLQFKIEQFHKNKYLPIYYRVYNLKE